jgi:hypothetical protein
MDRGVVEVVVRLGDTLLDVAHVPPAGCYRIGTAAGCELAALGLTCFPIVDGGTIHTPVGLPVSRRGDAIVLRVGLVDIELGRIARQAVSLARPRVDLRMPLFVLASLALHLAVWLAAELHAPLERLAESPRMRVARLVEKPVPLPPEHPVEPRQRAAPASAQPARRARVAKSSRSAARSEHDHRAVTVSSAVASVLKSFDDTRVVEQVSALTEEGQYIEDDANAQGFGGGRRFDPSQREGFESVKSTGYAIIPHDVRLCPKKSCEVVGPIPALYVRTHLHHHMDAIYDCYLAHASGPGTIVLEFTITGDGAVRDARGSGLGETGACAARVVGEIFFKALERETRVRYPVLFK